MKENTFNLQTVLGMANCAIVIQNYYTYEQLVKTVPMRTNMTATAMSLSALSLATLGIFIFSQHANQEKISVFVTKRNWS